MDAVIKKLYQGDSAELIHELITVYQSKGHAVVNFLYFANAMQYKLFEKAKESPKARKYKESLLESDFLLPDGIALQLWSKWTEKKSLRNLNGTDLTPEVLAYLNDHHKTSVYIYSLYDPKIWKWKEWLEKAVDRMKHDYPNIEFRWCHQSEYKHRGDDFPFDQAEQATERDTSAIRLFLNCTWTPFQELWVEEHRTFFEKHFFLVMNVGGFIDFMAGFEQRAPRWVVKARVLETFWRIATNPKKNLKKFLAMFGIFRILMQKMRLKK